MTNYTKKVVKGSAIVFVLSAFAAVAGYAVRLIFARNLTTEEFGLFYSILAFLTIVIVFADLGLTKALTNFISKYRAKNDQDSVKSSIVTVTLIHLASYLIIGFVIFLSSDFLSLHYFKVPNSSMLLNLVMISFFFNSFVYILYYSFQGFQKMEYFASVDLFRMIFIMLISFFLFNFGFGVLTTGIAYIASTLLLIAVYYFALVKKVFPDFHKAKASLSKSLTKSLFRFGIPVAIGASGTVILGLTDTLMLTFFSTLENVGLYNVAIPTSRLLWFFGAAIGSTLFPLASELQARNKVAMIKLGVELLYKYSFILILPFSLVLFSFPEIIIRLLYGESYLGAAQVLRILSIAAISMALHQITSNIIIGIGKPGINSRFTYIATGFNIISNFFAIPRYGIEGAATVTLLTFTLLLALNLIYLYKELNIIVPVKKWLLNIIAAIVFLLVINFMKSLLNINPWAELAIVSFFALAVYVCMVFVLKLADLKEIREFISRLRQ